MPSGLRIALLGASGVQVLLFLWAIYASTIGVGALVWGGLGFGLIGIICALFGVMLGLGWFARGPAMGALCVAGATLTCGVLGWLDLRSNLNSVPALAGLVRPWLLGVAFAALAQGGVAAFAVLLRRALSWKYLVFGAVILGLCAGMLALVRGPGSGLLTAWEGGGEALRVTILLALSFVALAMLSAGGHLVIRAFEVTREGPTPTDGPSDGQSGARAKPSAPSKPATA